MLSMTNLRTLVAVADSGGIRQAAKKLGRTPSAVSMALKSMEETLGAPLFEGDRKTHVTRLGKLTLESARDLVSYYDNTCASITAHSRHEISRCTIGSVTSIAGTILPLAIQRIQKRARNFEVVLREIHSVRMVDHVADGLIDAGLSRSVAMRPEVHFEPLLKDSYSLVCSPNHHFADQKVPLSWDQIQSETLISNESYDGYIQDKLSSGPSSVACHVSSASSAFAMVRAEVGVTILPGLAAMVAPPSVVFLRINDESAFRTVGVLTRRRRSLSPAVNSLLREMRKIVNDLSFDFRIS